jgi:broad specificity phosphatase PhoE
VDDCLRERYPGVGFFMTRESFQEKYADFSFAHKHNSYFLTPPGGESFASREAGVITFMSKTFARNRTGYGKRELVFAFTHGGFMRAVEKIAIYGENPDEIKSPTNCMMYVVKGRMVSDFGFVIDSFKKIDLLKPI